MPVFGHAQRVRARHNRVALVHTGQPSWRTRLRRAWRRAWPSLPKSDEEILVEMCLASKFGHMDWPREPMPGFRLLKPLPKCMLAADGKTSFRYFKVQKAACTSVVRMLMESCGRRGDLDKSTPLRKRARKVPYAYDDEPALIVALKGAGWHREPFFCRYKPFAPEPHADIRFCVVRDPVVRFQAAFDEVVVKRRVHQSITMEQFLHEMEQTAEAATRDRSDYRVGGFARDMHFRPQHFSLGENAGYFTHIFNLHQLPQLRDLLSELAGEEIPLIHANARAGHQKTELTAEQKKRVAALYARDYEIFGRWF